MNTPNKIADNYRDSTHKNSLSYSENRIPKFREPLIKVVWLRNKSSCELSRLTRRCTRTWISQTLLPWKIVSGNNSNNLPENLQNERII